ncbi:hypothetical protein CDAR_595541 [Caerostris darwini]|uniref:Uncharacterized protein n=1 Tax=Caerostris darwini TaxID=1538125 RepID=A0AAV4P8T5_9ARAC|nr:hypothetical protein CDAR_595541 [Caerostris darwini]
MSGQEQSKTYCCVTVNWILAKEDLFTFFALDSPICEANGDRGMQLSRCQDIIARIKSVDFRDQPNLILQPVLGRQYLMHFLFFSFTILAFLRVWRQGRLFIVNSHTSSP